MMKEKREPWEEAQVKEWLADYRKVMAMLEDPLRSLHPVVIYIIGLSLSKGAAELIRRSKDIKSVAIAEQCMKWAEVVCEAQAMEFAERHEIYFKTCRLCGATGGYHYGECKYADTTKF